MPVALHHNEGPRRVLDAITLLLKNIRVPVIVYILGPMPRYLHGRCCNDQCHMEGYSEENIPETTLNQISVLDANLKAAIDRRINGKYITAKHLAYLATDERTPIHEAMKGLATPSNVFLSAHGGKLVYTHACKVCCNEKHLAGIAAGFQEMERNPGAREDERRTYNNEMKRLKEEARAVEAAASASDSEVIDLE